MPSQEQTRPASARVRLARIAERVLAADEQVGPTAAGGRWVTRDADRTIPGVVVVESAGGAVDVSLHLVVAAPTEPLENTAGRVRAAIVAAAAAAGLGGRLGSIDVEFHDLAPVESEAVA
jgi:hypothetical protein